jgi:hypothetical protein
MSSGHNRWAKLASVHLNQENKSCARSSGHNRGKEARFQESSDWHLITGLGDFSISRIFHVL